MASSVASPPLKSLSTTDMAAVTVVSDGTPYGTDVIDQDGKKIVGWSKATVVIGPRGPSRLFLEFAAVQCEARDLIPEERKQS
jgi:hypothetical protein